MLDAIKTSHFTKTSFKFDKENMFKLMCPLILFIFRYRWIFQIFYFTEH